MAGPEPELVAEWSPSAGHLREALEEIARLASGRRAGAMGKILAVATVALETEKTAKDEARPR